MTKLRSNVAFLRLFGGRLVTNVGDSLYLIAAMWLVYELTGSTLYTGLAGFLVRLPQALQFLFGPLVDRWDLRSILVGSQLAQGVCVLVIPIAAVLGHLNAFVVLLVMPLISVLNQFVYPAQNAALPLVVEEENLTKANSLLSMAYQSADAIFNAISGIVIVIVGAVALFVVNSVTFLIAAVLFYGLVIPPRADPEPDASSGSRPDPSPGAGPDHSSGSGPDHSSDEAPIAPAADGPDASTDGEPDSLAADGSGESADGDPSTPSADGSNSSSDGEPNDPSDDVPGPSDRDTSDEAVGGWSEYKRELWAGIEYVSGSAILTIVLGVMIANAAFGAVLAILPAFADGLGGSETYGFLMAAYAGGVFVGKLASNLVDDVPYGRLCIGAMFIASGGLFGALVVPGLVGTLVLFFLTFVPIGAFSVLFWTLVQSTVDERLLGRVVSLVGSVSAVMLPIGSAVGGVAGETLGVEYVIASLSLALALLGAYFLLNGRVRTLPAVGTATRADLGLGRASAPG